ncbi:hypothetical protein [Serratia marcescens]|uniref:hypothetical protein n=1 Tax=Serratia marcescens TaxID=615 RepID=UPI0036FB13BD
MDNKLSELSKPVMYSITCNGVVEEIGCDSQGFVREEVQAELDSWENGSVGITDGYSVSALYSQEYVSALDKVAQFWIGETAGWKKRAEDADKRIAELSRLLAHNIERAEAAEAKLATPVRLPNKNDDEFWFDNVFQVAKFDRAVERAISAAGFKFVGDE